MTGLELANTLPRGLQDAAMLSLFGALVFQRVVVPRGAEGMPAIAVNRIVWCSAVGALLLAAVWLIDTAAGMAGASDLATLVPAVKLVTLRTSFGTYLGVRLLLLVLVLALLPFRAAAPRWIALLAAAAAVALQPFLGHIGASEVPVLIVVEMAHLLAAGAWLGALAPLLIGVIRAPAPLAATLCERFTPLGLVAVGTIAVTALPQAGELIGGLGGLFGTTYGHFALIKLGLFVLALLLACANRFGLTARLEAGRGRSGLIASIALEVVGVLCVVLAAGAMASSTPAAHVEPVWPFGWRPSLEAWSEPDARWQLLRLLIAALIAALLFGAALATRRFVLLAAVLAMAIVAPFTPALALLLVPAFPTSYAQSSTGFSVASIVHGEELFQRDCALCHAAQAGTGSEADLTAPHLWGHLDGELYWWISDGVQDARGNGLMPAFRSMLSADDRWSLIDYIRAHNIGEQAAATGHWAPSIPAPGTPLLCAGRTADTIASLAGETLVVTVTGDAPADPAAAVADAVTILLPRGTEAPPPAGGCTAASAEAWEAWRVVSGRSAAAFPGSRAIVDSAGWLRAWLPAGADAAAIEGAVRDAREHPLIAAPPPAHHH